MQNVSGQQLSTSMPPYIPPVQMENPIQSLTASSQIAGQGYGNQLSSPSWAGGPIRQSSPGPGMEPYSQTVGRYYQGSFPAQQNSSDVTQYMTSAPNSHHHHHHPNPSAYGSQYVASRQNHYPSSGIQSSYAGNLKPNYATPYYGNVQQGTYAAENVSARQTPYAGSTYYPTKPVQCVPPGAQHQSAHAAASVVRPNVAPAVAAAAVQQQQASYPKQSMQYSKYVSGYSPYGSETQQGYSAKQYAATSSASHASSTSAITSAQTNGQLSSIPTPPETTTPGDVPGSDGPGVDSVLDCGKVTQACSSSYGTTVTYSSAAFPSSNASITATSNGLDSARVQNWNAGAPPLQPSPNIDEGSQASSASASSSIPDEQNSAKANSKPNFSYPPTPNTLSSPGAASMSSFHDDLECISSPGWPRTPASPVAPTNNSYEFANVKRPESLLKLYSLSDEPERRYFLDKLLVFNEDRGSPITQCPTISKQPLDVFRVYMAVKERGGFVEVTNAKRWKDVAGAIGVGASSSAAYTLRKQYMKLLLPFECKYDRGGIDPQPIINQVEASSRKKGKNSTSGNQNMCLPGYHQSMDNYHSPSYAECYASPRYQCGPGNVDYRYAQNSPHYQQAMQQPQQHHPPGGSPMASQQQQQQQYGQYQRNCQTPYSYYPGSSASSSSSSHGSTSNSMPVPYNNNNNSHQSSINSNMCRYSASSSTPIPSTSVPDGGYCANNYASQQSYATQGNSAYKYGYNEQEAPSPGVLHSDRTVSPGQAVPYANYAGPNSATVISSTDSKPSATVQESNGASCKSSLDSNLEDSANDSSSLSSGNSSSLDNSSYGQSFASAKPVFQEHQLSASPAPCPTPKPSPSSTPSGQSPYQPSPAAESKNDDSNCAVSAAAAITSIPSTVPSSSSSSTPPSSAATAAAAAGAVSTSDTFSASSTGLASNNAAHPGYSQPSSYQNMCQQRPQNSHPGHYGQYVNASNESYRGSEGPPTYPPRMAPQQQNKYSGCAKEMPNNYTPTYSVNNQPPPKQPAYGSYPNYGHVQSANKEQYHANYYKTPYTNTAGAPGRPKGWNANSCYPYQNERPVSSAVSPAAAVDNSMTENKRQPEGVRGPKPSGNTTEPQRADTKGTAQLTSSPHVHYVQSRKMSSLHPSATSTTVTAPAPPPPPPHCYVPAPKKPIEFPPDSVESVKPNYRKKRRYSAKRVSPLDPWKLMMSLKSGLLSESTWALNALSVLLCDNSSAIYFRLSHLPGLLSVLVEHYRRFLNVIFNLFVDVEIGAEKKKCKSLESKDCLSGIPSMCGCKNRKRTSSFNWNGKSDVLDSPNYTFRTRCSKSVNIQYDEALFLIDPEQKWDAYEGFDVNANHWQTGFCDTTDHIALPFESVSGKTKFFRDMDAEKQREATNSESSADISKDCKSKQSLLPCKGEPIVVLRKCNLWHKRLLKDSRSEDGIGSDTENSRTSTENDSDDTSFNGADHNGKGSDAESSVSNGFSRPLDFSSINADSVALAGKTRGVDLSLTLRSDEIKPESQERDTTKVKTEPSGGGGGTQDANAPADQQSADDESKQAKKSENSSFPRLRDSECRKRARADELEDEAYSCDKPSLNLLTEQQDALVRRCMCISNILRNLSFIPGNDAEMSKNPSFLLVLGKLLLLHHSHKPVKPAHRKYDKDVEVGEVDDSCVSLRDDHEWWNSLLHVLRDNTLVVLSNIAGQMDLTPFPEEISLPILDGLLHWVVCPSSYARDPLPVKPSLSVLTPQRLSLEILSKLSVQDNNVDLMIATPPWSRIEQMFEFLSRCLSPVEDKVLREFSVILLSSLSLADSTVARTIASHHGQCISHLIAFIEQAEASAFQIASTQGAKKLKDNPEIIGTTPAMVERAANTLKNLASVEENRTAFFRYQQRLLTLATSQIIDEELASIISDILFHCSAGPENEGCLQSIAS